MENPGNIIHKGEHFNVTRADPTIRDVVIGVGWDQKAFEEQKTDADISLFLLDRDGQTREDEDFIFYNQPEGCEGAVRHMGDNRTGAGDGDDEMVFVNLNGLPFDIMKIAIVLSIYDEDGKLGHDFSTVRNVFVRLVNDENAHEIVRFEIPDEALEQGGTAMYMAYLRREGPEWFFDASAEKVDGGLAAIATEHGIIVKELQSTGT